MEVLAKRDNVDDFGPQKEGRRGLLQLVVLKEASSPHLDVGSVRGQRGATWLSGDRLEPPVRATKKFGQVRV